ncbi:TetR/AcrR family transcriptional regulator [soil metagenome]
MKSIAKLSSEQRRSAIIRAVRQVFAEKGFHGTTTRELARAAGVSEALLFKHFPNKEALFAAMMMACCSQEEIDRFERLRELEPSTTTLVLMVHNLVSFFLDRTGDLNPELAIQDRMLLRSLAEDGEFARHVYAKLSSSWLPGIVACLKASNRAGDTIQQESKPDAMGWFLHSLPLIIHMLLLPANPIVNFHVRNKALVEQTVRFLLRGVGLKDSVAARLYTSKTLSRLTALDKST